MVIIENAYNATMNAQELASVLTEWLQSGRDDYFELTYAVDRDRPDRSVKIRPVDRSSVSRLANGAEHIACVTPNGENIGLLIPSPEGRRVYKAVVFVPRS